MESFRDTVSNGSSQSPVFFITGVALDTDVENARRTDTSKLKVDLHRIVSRILDDTKACLDHKSLRVFDQWRLKSRVSGPKI
jgi:hypothetical protein